MFWLCDGHADVAPPPRLVHGHFGRHVYTIARTCRCNSLGAEHPPCGAAADYLVITGHRTAEGYPYLGVVSVCEKHAKAEEKPDSSISF